MEMSQGRFRSDTKKRFSTQRVAGHWNKLPGEVVTVLDLSEFTKHLDNALGHVV